MSKNASGTVRRTARAPVQAGKVLTGKQMAGRNLYELVSLSTTQALSSSNRLGLERVEILIEPRA